jgi:hypothetical protein
LERKLVYQLPRGKIHKYQWMKRHYSKDGKVEIGMKAYVDNMLNELPDDVDGTSATPAGSLDDFCGLRLRFFFGKHHSVIPKFTVNYAVKQITVKKRNYGGSRNLLLPYKTVITVISP